MSDTKVKRNVKVEIIRLIACMAVIWYHVRELPWKTNGELSETAVFFESLCTICVMTFFLITGFFIYNKKGNIFSDWLSLIKKFLTQVFVPFLFVVIFTIIFHDFLISKDTFIGCIQKFSIVNIFTSLYDMLRYFTVIYLPGTAAHLWYVFSYAIIIIAYPITRFVLTKLQKYVGYIVLVILTICMIVNDYYLFFGNPTYNLIFKIIHKPIYYSAWGHVLYNDILKKYVDCECTQNCARITRAYDSVGASENVGASIASPCMGELREPVIINVPMFITALVIYVITFIALFLTQVNYYLTLNGEYVYTSWLSLYSLVLTSAFVVMAYNINFEKFLNEKINSIIYFISNRTLYIYLIHYLIITKLMSVGFQNIFTNNRPNIFYHLAYYVLYSLFIFNATFAVVLMIEYIIKQVNKLLFHRS